MGSRKIENQLAAVILEIFDAMAQQMRGCSIGDIADEDDRNAVMDEAKSVMENWHEFHEFDRDAFSNPVLMNALLTMYSDVLAANREAENLDTKDDQPKRPLH